MPGGGGAERTNPRPRRRVALDAAAGAALFAVALLLFHATVLRLDVATSRGRDLDPSPDAQEYFAGAVNLWRAGTYGIHLAGELHPPRYPFGYSLLQVPLLALGVEPIRVPFLVNRICGAMLLAAVFLLLWRRGLRWAAGVAPLALAALPAFVIASRSPLSEMTSTCVLFAAAAAIAAHARSGRLSPALAAGALLGAATWFRIPNVLFVPAALAAPWLPTGVPAVARWRRAAAVGVAVFAGMLPLLWWQWAVLGSPWTTGYSAWVPHWAKVENAFAWRWVAANLEVWWREALQQEPPGTVASLYGAGSQFGPVIVVLGVAALLLRARDRLVRWCAFWLGAYVVAMAFYFFQDARFLFPVLAGGCVAVGLAAERLRRGRRGLAILGALLLALHAAGVPAGDSTAGAISESRWLMGTWRWQGPAPAYELVGELRGLEPRPGLVLTDVGPPYVHALLDPGNVVAPIGPRSLYEHNPARFSFGERERRLAVAGALAASKPVYALVVGAGEGLDESCPAPEGWRWNVLHRRPDGGCLAVLAPRGG